MAPSGAETEPPRLLLCGPHRTRLGATSLLPLVPLELSRRPWPGHRWPKKPGGRQERKGLGAHLVPSIPPATLTGLCGQGLGALHAKASMLRGHLLLLGFWYLGDPLSEAQSGVVNKLRSELTWER